MLERHEGFFNNRKNDVTNDRKYNIIKSSLACTAASLIAVSSGVLCWLTADFAKTLIMTNSREVSFTELYVTVLGALLLSVTAFVASGATVFFLDMSIHDYYKYKNAIEDPELDRLLPHTM